MIRYFAAHPTAGNLLMLIFLASGALAASRLQRETFPDFRSSEVEIRVVYPGATAEEIERSICERIEDAIDGVRFVKEVRSEARAGVGIVVAEMTDAGDIITFKDEIDTQVNAIDDFPDEAEEPVVTELNTTDPVLSLLVGGPMSPADLKTHCEQIKDRLQRLPEISLVTVRGFADRQFRVALSAEALQRFGLSAARVADAISRQSIDLPAGVLETDERDVVIRFADRRKTTRAIAEIVVMGQAGGAEIRIRDLGTVSEEFELAEEKILLNGRRAGILAIAKTKNQDTIRVADAVRGFIAEECSRQPNVDLAITQDLSTLVQDRLGLLIKNGWQGMILVFVAMSLFFTMRLSFWVVMSLPVSFLGAFFLVPYFGMTINMLTMVGLLLALGILMDDGIVVAENIFVHRSAGEPALTAAVNGTRGVAGGVISSFATTVCVLGPLVGLAGDIGKVLRVVPIILILVLVISLVEVFLILPAHLAHSLAHHDGERRNRVRRALDEAFVYLRERIVGRVVDRLIAARYAWLGIVVMLFLVVVGLVVGGVAQFKAFPDLDGDTIVSRLLLPPGTPLARTEAAVAQISRALDAVNTQFKPRQPDRQDLVKQVYVEFNKNADAFETGSHVATVTADLLSADRRDARIDDILQAWRTAVGPVPDAVSIVFTEPNIGPAGRSVELRLQGRDLDVLAVAANAVKEYLDQFVGVFNLSTDLRRGRPEILVRLREGTVGLGLDAATVAGQLRTAFQGRTADELQLEVDAFEIDVQFGADEQRSYADLANFYCVLPTGESVPLDAVAELTPGRSWSRITRVDGLRTVTLRGDTDPLLANTNKVLAQFRAECIPDIQSRFPGVEIDFEGESEEARQTQGSMLRGAMVGLLGVFVLLSFQFKSYVEPVMVMAAIPLALIGVVLGHLVMGLDISMPSMLGFISLAGIVVNDSILLVLFLKAQRAKGAAPAEAAGQASRQRLRAILITSLTTMAGLLPLTLERSLQAQVLIPLAVSIVFGLLASTLFVLSVIPCMYVVLDDLGLTARLSTDDAAAS